MLLKLESIGKSFGDVEILSDVNATLSPMDRVAIVGKNGAGKTTLLKLITKELSCEHGSMNLSNNVTLGYLKQHSSYSSSATVYSEMNDAFIAVKQNALQLKYIEELLLLDIHNQELVDEHSRLLSKVEQLDGYNIDVNIKKILSGMGFTTQEYEKPASVLSGGEGTRLELAKLLAESPDILVLDEPTNHLDFSMLYWLENFLIGYKGAVVIVTHDRYFLDKVANKIWDIEFSGLTAYSGSFENFLAAKDASKIQQQKNHDSDTKKIAELQDFVSRNIARASTSGMAKGRRKQLEKIQLTQRPKYVQSKLNFNFKFDIEPYKDVIQIENLKVSVNENTLVDNINMTLLRGERLLIAGANGTGKTTLLNLIAKKAKPTAGRIKLGQGVVLSYFEQHYKPKAGRIIDVVWNIAPKLTELEVRSLIARFEFKGEEVFKDVKNLSGGEIARLRLCEIYLANANLILFDEPTNHLDIFTRQELTKALKAYKGTLIIISHDRYLINELNCRILLIQGKTASFYDTPTGLMENIVINSKISLSTKTSQTLLKNSQSVRNGTKENNRKQKAALRNKIFLLEKELEQLSIQNEAYKEKLAGNTQKLSHSEINEIYTLLHNNDISHDVLLETWVNVSQQLEEIDNL